MQAAQSAANKQRVTVRIDSIARSADNACEICSGMVKMIALLDRSVATLLAAGRWLAIPIALTLFLQWPLRDWVHAYSRDANDLGQWLFALYVAMCITAATRDRMHLSADAVARHYSEQVRNWIARAGALLGTIPWAIFVLVTSRNLVWSSITHRELFQDTLNGGYFMIKAALWLLAFLVLVQGTIDVFRSPGTRS